MANDTDLVIRLRAETERLQRDLDRAKKKMSSFKSQSSRIASEIRGQIAGAFAIGAIASFGASVVQTTAEFQKLKAVLTNTLGSQSEAQKSFDMINKFAAQTPFSVLELTDSFVKLANFGLKPTQSALRAYGDLAASTGKSFDQLSEAIIDATTGEFERLKEFGIRASKQGDQVEFTFKGVKTQVDFTSDSIRDYIESLGNVEGVSGGMAAVSGTLAGKLSNLGDNFTALKATIGELVAGPLADFLDKLNVSLKSIQNFDLVVSTMFDSFQSLTDTEVKRLVDVGMITESGKEVKSLIDQFIELNSQGQSWQKTQKDFIDTFVAEGESVKDATKLWRIYELQVAKAFASISTGTTATPAQQSGSSSGTTKKTFALGPELAAIAEMPDISAPLGKVPMQLQEFRSRTLDELSKTNEMLKASFFELQNVVLESGQQVQAVFLNIGDVISGGMMAIVSGLQTDGLRGALANLKRFLGDAMVSLGQALVAVNTGKLALTKVPPPAGIAIGASLIAAGALLNASAQSKLSSISSSSGLGGGGRLSGGNVSGGQSINLTGQFRVKGSDLVYVLDRERQITGRTG